MNQNTERESSLLLLSIEDVNDATQKTQIISELSRRICKDPNTELIIWVTSPIFANENHEQTFKDVESILQKLYTSGCQSPTEKVTDVLPVTVLFAGWCGWKLSEIRQNWSIVFYPSGLSHEELQQSTLLQCNKWEAYDESTQKQYEPSLFTNPPISESLNSSSVVAAGGTFDHLHVGHKILLTMSAWLGNNVSIGISCDALLKNKQYKEMLESFDARTEGVAKFLKFVRKDTNPFLFPLYDVFGPTITEPNIDYLVVSRETEQGGVMIQAKRKVSKLKPLKVFTISLISIEISVQLGTAQQKLSSTEIRKELSMVC